MHFYWRIIEELKFLGENIVFLDPSLLRSYRHWLDKNAAAISLSMEMNTAPLFRVNDIPQSLN